MPETPHYPTNGNGDNIGDQSVGSDGPSGRRSPRSRYLLWVVGVVIVVAVVVLHLSGVLGPGEH